MNWELLTKTVLPWLGVFSAVSLLLMLIAVPAVVARLPADYFVSENRPAFDRGPLGVVVLVLRNILGIFLILLGLVLLLLPGQGVLTVLVGLVLVDFPGKWKAERWLVGRPGVGKAINWVRGKAGRKPMEIPGD